MMSEERPYQEIAVELIDIATLSRYTNAKVLSQVLVSPLILNREPS